MQKEQKAEGFASQKIIVLPDSLLNEISCHPLVEPLYVSDIGLFPRAQHHYRDRPTGCDAHIFIYCVAGEGWVMLGNSHKIAVPENSVFVIPAHTPHSYGADETNPWSIYWFHLKGEAVAQFIHSFGTSHSTLRVPAKQAANILNLFEQCYETLLYKGYSLRHHLYVSQVMRHLLGILMLAQGESRPDEKKDVYVEQAIQYMLERVQSSLSLDELAAFVHLSRSHLLSLFKKVTGYSPIDYFNHLKIQRACQYLDFSDASVKEISKYVGIDDPYYFSRMFTQKMGLSPSAYRKTKRM